MFESSFTFLKVRGIRIGAHWSWLFVFALVTWALASQLFPRTYPGLDPATYWAMAVGAAVVFFLSILAHELGHALTAVGKGMEIEGITLWLFGGVARFTSRFPGPGAEFLIAVAGPAVSLVLALLFAALAWLGNAADWPATLLGVVDYLARINAIVLGFNLVPALPLDGGRVLRAWLWKRQESFEAATVTAARAGRIFGMILIGLGLLGFFTGADTGGLWIAFIGWFLLQAAQAEAADAAIRAAFTGRRVRDLMASDPVVVPPDLTVDELLERAERPGSPSSYPVVEEGRLAGFVSLKNAGEVPRRERKRTRVSDVMMQRDDVPTIAPDAEVAAAIDVLQAGPGRAVVVTDGHVEGVLSTTDLVRSLELRRIRGDLPQPRAKSAGLLPWAVIAVAFFVAAGALYHPPVLVIAPGPATDVAGTIRIDGAEFDEVNGEYLLTSVSLARPTGLGAVYALFHPNRELLSVSSVIPEGVEPDEYFRRQRQVFRESQEMAAAAAARLAGQDVEVTGNGARVVDVVAGSPAAQELQVGDVIVEVAGRRISLANEVGEIIRSRPQGTRFEMTVVRDGERRTVTLRTVRLENVPDVNFGIGVVLETRNFDISLPFEVDFTDQDIGGPSAGLAYALAIADMLRPADLAGGRTIATTGTIDFRGDIGAVGGVAQKAEAAEDAGADLFLVPEAEVEQARGADVEIRGVGTLRDAVRALRETARGSA